MRTTLEIDDDVIEEAKDLARLKNQSLGRSISELARRGLAARPEPRTEIRNGVPVWLSPPGAIPVTPEMIRKFIEEED
jgi:Bacterial antitoxin of type II TA system, VapB